ncbi:MAG: DUF1669 domain-containing protein [Epsilonproteobacteria bacterium]|nr:DUF1669 domain-containing protein [Campylobacterota bacterium]
MKKIILILCVLIGLRADVVYFLPKDGDKAEKHIASLFKHAHENIKIAIYAFTNRKFLKALKIAARKGVKVFIVADYESNKNQQYRSIIPELRKLRNIKIKLLKHKNKGYDGIMHIKMFIVDDITVGFGSANYTYSAFHKNYELLYINNDWTFTRRFISIFNQLYKGK